MAEPHEFSLHPKIKTLLVRKFTQGLTAPEITAQLIKNGIKKAGVLPALDILIARGEVTREGDIYVPVIRKFGLNDANKTRQLLGCSKDEREETREFVKKINGESEPVTTEDQTVVAVASEALPKKDMKVPVCKMVIDYLKDHPNAKDQGEIANALGIRTKQVHDAVHHIRKSYPEHADKLEGISRKFYRERTKKKETTQTPPCETLTQLETLGAVIQRGLMIEGIPCVKECVPTLRGLATHLDGIGFDLIKQHLVAAAEFIERVTR